MLSVGITSVEGQPGRVTCVCAVDKWLVTHGPIDRYIRMKPVADWFPDLVSFCRMSREMKGRDKEVGGSGCDK